MGVAATVPPVFEPDGAEAYVARWGPRELAGSLVSFGVVAVLLVVFREQRNLGVWLAAAAFFAAGVAFAKQAARRLGTRAVALAIDANGVYLGEDHLHPEPEQFPWSAVESVIYFRHRSRSSENRAESVCDYVGVVRPGGVESIRRVQGWKLDLGRLLGSTRRYGGGTPVRQTPDRTGAFPGR